MVKSARSYSKKIMLWFKQSAWELLFVFSFSLVILLCYFLLITGSVSSGGTASFPGIVNGSLSLRSVVIVLVGSMVACFTLLFIAVHSRFLERQIRQRSTIIEALQKTQKKLKKSQKDLQHRTEKLAQSNVELEKEVDVRKKAEQKLKQLDRVKNQFISMVSHELRTPMTVVKGYIDIMITEDYGPISTAQSDCLHKVMKNVDHLIGLVNEMLDVSKLEAGKMEMDFAFTPIAPLVEGVIEDLEVLFHEKGIHLRFIDILPRGTKILADKKMLQGVVNNLLSNAYKFTSPDGEVSVTLDVDPHKKNTLLIKVTDNGIGIPKEEQRGVFEKFNQAHNQLQKPHEGTGLGLAIVKNVVRKHHGKVWLESELGKGTTFFVSLPISKISQTKHAV